MSESQEAPPDRVLVLTAHPDDTEFCVAGTVMQWTALGTEVTYCVLTDGDSGGYDDGLPRQSISPLRRAEQRAAAGYAGVREVRFLGYPDGRLEPSIELRRDIARVIRQVRPQVVLMPSPEINWARIADTHPDHRAAGEAALRAVYPDARNPYAHPELRAQGLEAWEVPEIWLIMGPSPNHFVDVTDLFERKLAALRLHTSQTAHVADLEALLRRWQTEHAVSGGLPAGRLAEAFQVIRL
ncbi:PIG-L deacetylase family protein [Kitasatospora cathayae]|uniref:PIG-L family deacetylase n=1 Tax=Kitasatospora cathayae TaxID=3004092 RepID=A0ABY7PXE7_9ACTN|nr:PIG-L deacetylase family protein [Kitasatospora sp. HUAS 3-15]WBP85083.1 PIG-L family deacetylase [Kitasatospora sp. HUAS 3-15]